MKTVHHYYGIMEIISRHELRTVIETNENIAERRHYRLISLIENGIRIFQPVYITMGSSFSHLIHMKTENTQISESNENEKKKKIYLIFNRAEKYIKSNIGPGCC